MRIFTLHSLLSLLLSLVVLASIANSEPVKIGIIAPLTGPVADYGVAIVNGAKMAVADGASDTLELKFEDNQYETKSAISAFEKLRREGVKIIYQWGSLPTETLSNLAERNKIPLVVWTGDPTTIRGKKFTINAVPGPSVFIEPVIKRLREQGRTKIAFVTNHTPYTLGLKAALKDKLLPTEKIVFDESVAHGTQDFRGINLRLKNIDHDSVGAFLLEPDLSIWCKSAKALGLTGQVFGTDQFESAITIGRCAPVIDNAFYANHTQSAEFVERYKAQFGNDVQVPDASLSYALIQAFRSVFSTNPKTAEEIIEKIASIRDFDSIKGRTSVVENDGVRHFLWPVVLRSTR